MLRGDPAPSALVANHDLPRWPGDAHCVQAWTAAHKAKGEIGVSEPGTQLIPVAAYLDERKATEVSVACFSNPIPPFMQTPVRVVVGDEEGQPHIIGSNDSPASGRTVVARYRPCLDLAAEPPSDRLNIVDRDAPAKQRPTTVNQRLDLRRKSVSAHIERKEFEVLRRLERRDTV